MFVSDSAKHVALLEPKALKAQQEGRWQQAIDLWVVILGHQPNHLTALTHLGQAAHQVGDYGASRAAYQRAAELDGRDPRAWINVALCCRALHDDAGEEAALYKALAIDPYELFALLLRGQLFERQGKSSRAASAYGAAAAVAPPIERLSPELRPWVSRAMAFLDQHRRGLAEHMDQALAPHLRDCGPGGLDRFKLSLDILLGRKQRHDPQPMRYYMPGLPVVEFFDRSDTPWLDHIEAAWESIRDEFLAVHREDHGFTPYIEYGADQPVAQWAELNHSQQWSVYHLVKDGGPIDAHAARCPLTMAAWRSVPSPDQPGRTPVSLFSLLKPKTRIPPHTGASNCRLVNHLPLIVPSDCGFRVGNSTRQWEAGKAWAFDDTIEHEAFNNSDQLRVVWIFDTWHPWLSEQERALITALNGALNKFSASDHGGYDL